MKQSYCRSGVFHLFKTLGIFLTSLTLLSSCSNELDDFSSEQKEDNVTSASIKDDTVLRFKSIDEMENISVSDIPGDNNGFELKELSYECVDTIELRALRFDVKATLRSSSNQEKVIGFAAEVGPELVSVEYYPGGEMVPAHDNMATAFYPKVERYRNYSDGSRIGPDEFYDYGHFISLSIGLDGAGGEELFFGVTDYCYELIPNVIDNYIINPEQEWYENGIYYSRQESILDYNLNTTVIQDNGKSYSGEDLLPIQIKSGTYDSNSFYITEDWLKMVNNYYQTPISPNTGYCPSRTIDNNDSEKVEIYNLCRGVQDISPKPYPKVEGELMNGWYYCNLFDRWSLYTILNSNYFDILDNEIGYTSWGVGFLFDFYSQYLVIDGRIIHYDDFISKDYSGIKNIKQSKKSIAKDPEGYLAQFEVETTLYGERFKSLLDLHIRTHNGVPEVIDRSNYSSVKNSDAEEISSINDRNTRAGIQDSRDQIIINDSRKSFTVDENLPKSISCVKKYKTITKLH